MQFAELRESISRRLAEVVQEVERLQASEHREAVAGLERRQTESIASEAAELERRVRELLDDREARIMTEVKAQAALVRSMGEHLTIGLDGARGELETRMAQYRAELDAALESRHAKAVAAGTDRISVEMRTHIESRLADIERVLRQGSSVRLEEVLAKVRAEAEQRFEVEAASFRSKADAAREETSRRITSALERLEQRAACAVEEVGAGVAETRSHAEAARGERESVESLREAAIAEVRRARNAEAARLRSEAEKIELRGELAGAKLTQAAERLSDAEERLTGAAAEIISAAEVALGEKIGAALRRVDVTVATLEESAERIAELERRAGVAEREAARSAEMARNAVELEARMREALSMEAAAAEQIMLAERRLIDFVAHR